MESSGEVVVVTGAAGCLGFHVLRLLIAREQRLKELRCLDVRRPEAEMEKRLSEELAKRSSEPPAIKWIQGDVRDINVVERSLAGAQCVLHCAAKVDLWSEEADRDAEELESINVAGTECLLRAALGAGCSSFVHVSSFEAFASHDTIYYATEQTLPRVNWFLFGSSGSSKFHAEQLVRRYSNHKLPNRAGSLRTTIVRLPAIYGEFERSFVPHLCQVARFFKGRLPRFSYIWIRQQPIYAGNAAWALLCAKQSLAADPSISGQEFHVTDDTPIVDPFDFVEPFLESKGLRVAREAHFFLPTLLLVWLLSKFRRLFAHLNFLGHLFNPRKQPPETESSKGAKRQPSRWFHYLTPAFLGFMCNSMFLNRTKASLRLNYEPITDPDEAHRRSLAWYRDHLKV